MWIQVFMKCLCGYRKRKKKKKVWKVVNKNKEKQQMKTQLGPDQFFAGTHTSTALSYTLFLPSSVSFSASLSPSHNGPPSPAAARRWRRSNPPQEEEGHFLSQGLRRSPSPSLPHQRDLLHALLLRCLLPPPPLARQDPQPHPSPRRHSLRDRRHFLPHRLLHLPPRLLRHRLRPVLHLTRLQRRLGPRRRRYRFSLFLSLSLSLARNYQNALTGCLDYIILRGWRGDCKLRRGRRHALLRARVPPGRLSPRRGDSTRGAAAPDGAVAWGPAAGGVRLRLHFRAVLRNAGRVCADSGRGGGAVVVGWIRIHCADGHHGRVPCGEYQQRVQGHLCFWWGQQCGFEGLHV